MAELRQLESRPLEGAPLRGWLPVAWGRHVPAAWSMPRFGTLQHRFMPPLPCPPSSPLLPAGPGANDRLLRDVALVLTHRQMAAAAAAAAAEAASSGAAASTQLALLAACAARASMVVAAARGWPALAGLLLPHVTCDGRCGAGAPAAGMPCCLLRVAYS